MSIFQKTTLYQNLLKLFQNLEKQMPELVVQSVKEKEKEIVKINQTAMYEKGVMDVTQPNKRLAYSPATIKAKKKRATYKRTDHITLRWDGILYDNMEVQTRKDWFFISTNRDPWDLTKTERFENALGLTEDGISEGGAIILPLLAEKVKEKILQGVKG